MMRSRLQAIPGVDAVAANNLPLSGLSAGTKLYLERSSTEPEEITALLTAGQDNYFDVLGIPILAGRGFEPTDRRDSPPVALVNETMARRHWPDGNPIGRRLKSFDDTVWVEIVGVAADVRHNGLSSSTEPTVFLPAAQSGRETNEWILRVRQGDMAVAIQQARDVIASASPSTPVARTLILDETIARSVAIPRFRTFFILGLAGLAAVLALLGVYGVLAFAVAQRTKEIGIRMALGARSRNVLTGIVGSGLKLAATGIAVGLLAASSATSIIGSFLFEVAPNDPRTYFAVAVGLLAVTCLAAYLPARRAAAVNPAQVLNDD
jgi:putative ABC transport system permease protein